MNKDEFVQIKTNNGGMNMMNATEYRMNNATQDPPTAGGKCESAWWMLHYKWKHPSRPLPSSPEEIDVAMREFIDFVQGKTSRGEHDE